MTEQESLGQPLPSPSWQSVRDNWGWFLALGIFWIVMGALAIVLPFAATFAVALLIGALLGAGGIVQVVHAFRCKGWRGTALNGLIGLLSVVAGVLLLFFPLGGVLTLTLVLSVFFIAAGVFRTLAALQNRDLAGWGWMLFSGLLGIGVGLIIWLAWPESAVWALGLLVGIELTFSGWSMVMIALAARRRERAQDAA